MSKSTVNNDNINNTHSKFLNNTINGNCICTSKCNNTKGNKYEKPNKSSNKYINDINLIWLG